MMPCHWVFGCWPFEGIIFLWNIRSHWRSNTLSVSEKKMNHLKCRCDNSQLMITRKYNFWYCCYISISSFLFTCIIEINYLLSDSTKKNEASGLDQFVGHINPECKKSTQYDETIFSLHLCLNMTQSNILTYKPGILFCRARMWFLWQLRPTIRYLICNMFWATQSTVEPTKVKSNWFVGKETCLYLRQWTYSLFPLTD
jgi:hypothetical protein